MKIFFTLIFILVSANVKAQLTFTEVSASVGTGLNDGTTRGISWVDFNNDGFQDLFVPTAGTSPNKLYLNNRNGSFTEIAAAVGLNDLANTITCSWVDYDNDGDMDLLTTATGAPTRLWRNNRETGTDTTFTSVETIAGISMSGAQMVAWADFNNDGDIDFYSPISNSTSSPDGLYKNNGDGTFTNVASSAGVNNQVSGLLEQAIHWGDFNKDGYPELFIGNLQTGGESLFYLNNGNETFTSSAAVYGFNIAGRGSQWIDYNNDGYWDFCFASYAGGTTPIPVKIFRNNGNNTFTEVGSTIGITDNLVSWGVTCGDVDNNGYEDIFVAVSGSGTNCQLYLNNGDGTFSNATVSSGLGSQVQLEAALGDYNNDGWLDLYTTGSATNGNKLFLNNGVAGNHWLQIDLSGITSNQSGVGAQIDIVSGTFKMMREINTGIGYRSQNQLRAHFGLGTNIQADSVIVRWPSGTIDILTNIPADQIITVEEGETIPVELVSFTANVVGMDVVLNWITATEINNRGFEIEKKVIGNRLSVISNWEKIGFVAGYGTTAESKSYLFIDKNIIEGKFLYRLKQIDFDGSFKYYNFSESVEVGAPANYELAQNFPNPFNPTTRIKYAVQVDGFVNLSIYNILGEKVADVVNEIQKAGVYEITFDASSLSSGMYIYIIKVNNFEDVKKMLIMK